jgi:Uma2 family endonuclease
MSIPERKKEKNVTYQDYLTWPDAERWEIIHGEPWAMTPAPSIRHQRIVGRLFARLAQRFSVGPCVPFVSPIDVVLDETNIVQPDIILVCNPGLITEANIQGAPDLAMEVVSPSTILIDKREKKRLYERFGVREYWIIYPDDELVDRFLLKNDLFRGPDTFNWNERITLGLFPDLEIPLWEIFEKTPSED